jgi:hypothetical protein
MIFVSATSLGVDCVQPLVAFHATIAEGNRGLHAIRREQMAERKNNGIKLF